jgi:hypothetical protein
MVPQVGVPVIDLHGKSDTTVPANVSLSADGYYYTITSEIFYGNAYSKGWVSANGCSGSPEHYPTSYDNIKELYCVSEGRCSGGDVVRCAYKGGHNWFNGGGTDNGGVVTDFLLKWTKTSHVGNGYSRGDAMAPTQLIENIVIVDDSLAEEPLQWEETLQANAKGHYGNPTKGCLPDEDAIPAGSGHVCAPRIGVKADMVAPPSPNCKLGGVASDTSNGCPTDADVAKSRAWPVCLAKGNTTDPYDHGDFHCMLVCPCDDGEGKQSGGECNFRSHAHCPKGARCERGELRKRDQGVCTYPMDFETLV